jgi:hypothetical protein
MPMSTKCQENEKKMTIIVIEHDARFNIYDRFTMEHFPLCQSVILTTSFFFARDSTFCKKITTIVNEAKIIVNEIKLPKFM